MEKLDYWRLCDELSVIQAALLIVGVDPGEQPYVMNWQEHERPENFSAALAALSHAVLGGRLPATMRREAWVRGWEEEIESGENFTKEASLFPDQSKFPDQAEDYLVGHGILYRAAPDWNLTTVLVVDLQEWLRGRGFKAGFFFPQAGDQPDFLDPSHKCYAPKLAAAIGAWQAVSEDQELKKGKTVKQALLKWLRKHAGQFGLTKDDGNPNEQGLEEVAKVSNWVPQGGSPKTPV